jgi:hypothetical protein
MSARTSGCSRRSRKASPTQQRAEQDRVGADPQHQGQRPRARRDHQQQAEDDRQRATGSQPPLVRDLVAQPDGRHDLQHPGDERPGADHVDEHERREAGHRERHDAGGDAHEPLDGQQPPRPLLGVATEGGNQVEDTVDDGIGGEQQDEGCQRHAWQEERQEAENDRGRATNRQGPPVASQCRDVHERASCYEGRPGARRERVAVQPVRQEIAVKPPACLFDLDGALVDSVYQHVLAWREALEASGLDVAVCESTLGSA